MTFPTMMDESSPTTETESGTFLAKALRSQAMAEFSISGDLLMASPAFLSLFGYSLNEVKGQPHAALCETTAASDATQLWSRLCRGGVESGIYTRMGKNGRRILVAGSYTPVMNAQGGVERIIFLAQDITEREIASEDVRDKYTALMRSKGVAEYDRDGRLLSGNAQFLAMLDYKTLDEVKGREHRSFFEPRFVDSPEYRKLWDKARRGEVQAIETKRLGCDACERWVNSTYSPVKDHKGEVTSILEISRDVTAMREASNQASGVLDAIGRSQAVIEFDGQGKVLTANENFCNALGYKLSEIQGKQHSMFCEPGYAASAGYREFWQKLNRGEFIAGEFRRLGAGGRDVYIQASYNPVLNEEGKVVKIIKFAADVTAAKIRQIEAEGKVEAIGRSQAVIEFKTDGTIIDANANFCKTLGYPIEELRGKHHRILCDPRYAESHEYRQFWSKLASGQFDAGEYKRIAKDGHEIWIQATYNPIKDPEGRVVKICKFATDITEQKLSNAEAQGKLNAITKSQAVIEFKVDGTIITANENFLAVIGYTLDEIRGRHHRMFVESKYAESVEYRRFWDKLARGDYDAGEYKRVGRGGREIWVQATYNPIKDSEGRVFKVVKFATDVTEQRNRNAMFEGKVNAMEGKLKAAVAEYTLDGALISANENWLGMLHYNIEDVKGKHHREFCDSHFTSSGDYRLLWDKMSRGESASVEGLQVGKGGAQVWVQGSYTPIMNTDGKVLRVMSVASDLTTQHKREQEFGQQVALLEETANALAGSATELTKTAATMTTAANNTSKESVSASQSLSQVAHGVQTVAASTEQMVQSIREISRSANESAGMSKLTSATTQETNEVVKELGESSLEIGEVTKVISSIAQQTNLLALNATIEAARAGDAGKGFAVVANEVKELARQTAKATQDITQKIGAIQKNSSRAVEAIGNIAAAVDKLNAISGTIAAAVEQQTASTNEVSRVINDASDNVKQISTSVQLVSTTADENSAAASKTLDASNGLSTLAEKLKEIVRRVKTA